MSNRAYRPKIDLDGVLDRVVRAFEEDKRRRGVHVHYPTWVVRRYVAAEVIYEAGLSKPEIQDDHLGIFEGRRPLDEDPSLDERLDGVLRRHHLEEQVNVVIDALTSSQARTDVGARLQA